MSGSGIRRAFGKALGSIQCSAAGVLDEAQLWAELDGWGDGSVLGPWGGGRGGPTHGGLEEGRGVVQATRHGPDASKQVDQAPGWSSRIGPPAGGGGGLGGPGAGGRGHWGRQKERWVGSNEGIKKSGPLAVGHLQRGEVDGGWNSRCDAVRKGAGGFGRRRLSPYVPASQRLQQDQQTKWKAQNLTISLFRVPASMPLGTQQSSIVSVPLPSGQSGLLHGQ